MSTAPSRWFGHNRARGANVTLAVAVLVFGCDKEPSEAPQASPSGSALALAEAPRASAVPTGQFGCQHLMAADAGRGQPARRIRLRPPDFSGQTIVLDKTGVLVTFSRAEFLKTAQCLDLKQAVRYVEQDMGNAKESPLRDAFQLSYVAAALLDLGRVQVSLKGERELQPSIVRESWTDESCAGKCRLYGRGYKVSESDPWYFFRVVDERQDKPK